MSGFQAVWQGLDWSYILDMVISVIPALVCITLHELSHGLVAYWMGDDTAKRMGRLTLNPVKHIDWWGLLMMVLFKFGWAKPVPVNMYRFKNPKRGMAITALAGPVSNVLITVVCLVLYGLLYRPLYLSGSAAGAVVMELIVMTGYLSISLAVFNLLPVSPLDGSKVLYSFLSDSAYEKLMRYERYGMILVMILVATGGLSGVLSSVTGWVFDKLFVVAEVTFDLVNR